MKKFPNRKPIRLKNYNYSNNGYYFITICTQDRQCMFGEIPVGADPCVRPRMVLNNIGKMINQWYIKIPQRFKNVQLDEYQIMPNHLHGIIVINNDGSTHGLNDGSTHGLTPTDRISTPVGADLCVRPQSVNPRPSLPKTIQWFKTMTTNNYIRNVKNNNWEPFNKRIWQRSYYEHIVRTQTDLNKIQEYIQTNPLMWDRDRNNPENI